MINEWNEFFVRIKDKEYINELKNFLEEEYKNYEIYPKKENVLKAFELTSPKSIKVVIIGQDPYHEPNQAMGLSFSVPSNEKLPPSLKNIYKEIENDLGFTMKNDGDLSYLAKQGVLLINSYLTVRRSAPLSHHKKEYDEFMKDLISYINSLNQPIVFMLWGNFAKKYKKYLTNKNFLILESSHPSPLSANQGGWFNNHHFSKCNNFLIKNNLKPIDWKN